ncbi:MAG TPA: 2-oxoacid:acceptor oxidoreductase family protein [Candidatus Hydrogenedentes bacterium]|nr:2-oxoacid:acceptor oxidoreductase family protein [Candidatus Hydrogenedentota bacterium]HPG66239.1 2-oxoacid:acceptor oxidoreductase family protein [Candidatus Hydrogenedentota bacterium]
MSYFLSESTGGFCEIRWHGRGGQGAITSAKYLAEAAFLNGFRGVTSQPSFGAERRGAPVTASTRLSTEPLRMFSLVESPDLVVVLDETLLECAAPTGGLQNGGWIVVNSARDPEALGLEGGFRVATADAKGVSREVGLRVAGVAMVNTAMLGAVARATGLVDLEHIRLTLERHFPAPVAAKNFDAARITYDRTRV